MNTIKTALLLSGLTGLFLFIGYALGGYGGMFAALLFAAVMNIGSFWFSEKIVLSLHKAKKISATQYPDIVKMTKDMTIRQQIPMPNIYVFDDPTPNAFATGRNPKNSVVALSTGIIRLLSPEELKGVIAHELAHIKNRDVLLATIAATLAGALSFLVEMSFGLFSMFMPRTDDEGERNPLMGLALLILTPLIGLGIQMLISRNREYAADELGARMTGSPTGLISALKKLSQWSVQNKDHVHLTPRTEAVQHLYIFNHFQALGQLFSTHPPIEKRIERLKALV